MKNFVLLLFSVFVSGMISAQMSITDSERAFVVNYLEETRFKLYKTISGMTQEEWHYKPSADRWSPAEISEHILLAEKGLYHLLQSLSSSPGDPAKVRQSADRDDAILKWVTSREEKVLANARVTPKQIFDSPADFKLYFDNLRNRSVEFAGTNEAPLRAVYRKFVDQFGEIDGYQWLTFIAAHTERHIAQIQEIMHPGTQGTN